MNDLQLTDVQSANLHLLQAIRLGLEREGLTTCCKFALDAALADRLRDQSLDELMSFVVNFGQTSLFPPREDLLAPLAAPAPLAASLAAVRLPNPFRGTADVEPARCRMLTRADRHVGAILLPQQCAELGARCRTIHLITGLQPRELQWLFFTDPQATPRGRAPDSPEWYHSANLLHRAEASIFGSVYRRLRDAGFAAGEALVSAYRSYRSICQCPYRISFDRAFDLASHTDGIWLARNPAFSVVVCPACRSQFLAAFGTVAHCSDHCPFCRLVQRFGTDPRLQRSFRFHPPRAESAAPPMKPMALLARNRAGPDGDSRRQ